MAVLIVTLHDHKNKTVQVTHTKKKKKKEKCGKNQWEQFEEAMTKKKKRKQFMSI